jgi:hypothetical protein
MPKKRFWSGFQPWAPEGGRRRKGGLQSEVLQDILRFDGLNSGGLRYVSSVKDVPRPTKTVVLEKTLSRKTLRRKPPVP